MRRPDFLIVGTARAGTTALHYYLRSHPELFLPAQKEPCFFCFGEDKLNYKRGKFSFAVTDSDKYFRLFDKAASNQVTGEISTPYLYLHKQTIESIQKNYKGFSLPKIVIILRNPVERAYSQYLWKVRDGREELSFIDALKHENNRINQNYSIDYHYAHRGLYAEAVKSYLENFPFVKIILFENFKNRFESTLSELLIFLGVNKNFNFVKKEKINSSVKPIFPGLSKLVTFESKIKYTLLKYVPDSIRLSIKEQFYRLNSANTIVPPISEEARKLLLDFYQKDIFELQSVTGLNLNSWLQNE
jgi:hypothetical protein